MATEITSANFKTDVLESDQPVLVDFWAPWCGPCRAVGPVIDELAETYAGRAAVVKVNVDEAQDVAVEYGISSIPAFILFKGGEAKDRLTGAVSGDKLSSLIDGHLV